MRLAKVSALGLVMMGVVGTAQALDVAGLDLTKGEAGYKKSCFACHDTAVAGSPKLGDKTAWKPRLDQGMDTLVASVKKGKTAMPPMGTCASCTDEDFKNIIGYMASKSQ
jgi:cytochrome c5